MKNRLLRLVKNDSGATAIEYGMIAGLIAVVLIAAVTLVGESLTDAFEAIAAALPGGLPGGTEE